MRKNFLAFIFLVPFFVTACAEEQKASELRAEGVGIESFDVTRDTVRFPDRNDPALKDVRIMERGNYDLQKIVVYVEDSKDNYKTYFERQLEVLGVVRDQDTIVKRASFPAGITTPLRSDVQLNVPLRMSTDEKGNPLFLKRYYHWVKMDANHSWEVRTFGESIAGINLHPTFDVPHKLESTNVYQREDIHPHEYKPEKLFANGTMTFDGSIMTVFYLVKETPERTIQIQFVYKKVS